MANVGRGCVIKVYSLIFNDERVTEHLGHRQNRLSFFNLHLENVLEREEKTARTRPAAFFAGRTSSPVTAAYVGSCVVSVFCN